MIRLLIIFILPFSIYASKILSYNIYDRTDRVDVMITFDTPYDGIIRQSKSNSKIIIKLEDSIIESSKRKNLSSQYISSLSITPMSGYTQIEASIPESTIFRASKTSDSYGLRLRFSQAVAKKQTTQPNPLTSNNPTTELPTKKTSDMSQSYYIVVAILIIGIGILLFLKKKISLTPTQIKDNNKSSWLFKETTDPDTNTKEVQPQSNENVSIRFQKSLNEQNSVVMLDFAQQSYLVLMGNSNILLDKFTDNKPITQDDFESILQNRHQELENFLNGDGNKVEDAYEPLQSYKNKASSIAYEV